MKITAEGWLQHKEKAMQDIKTIGVVATGVIGASWVSYFLARGLSVVATDPAPGAEDKLRRAVEQHWPALQRAGLAGDASPSRLVFEPKLVEQNKSVNNFSDDFPLKHDFRWSLLSTIFAK